MPQHSIIHSDGTHSLVPSEQVPAAIRAGGKPAVPVQAPDGSTWHIPYARLDDALAAGGKLLDRVGESADTLGREVSAAGKSVAGLPSAVYHAASDPETSEESQRFGKGFESKIGPTGRVIDRLAVQPLLNAVEDYKNGRVSIDQVLANLPEAIGGAGGAVVTGKVASDIAGASKMPTASADPIDAASNNLSETAKAYHTSLPKDLKAVNVQDAGVTEAVPSAEAQAVAAEHLPKSDVTVDEPVSQPKVTEQELHDTASNYLKGQTARLKSTVSRGRAVDVHSIDAAHPETGESLGNLTMTEEPGSGVVRVQNASSNLRPGSGLGTRMYRQAINEAVGRGATEFRSDGVVSGPAQGVWNKLEAAGYPVERTAGKGGTQFSVPLDELRPKPETPTLDVTDEMNDSMVPVKVNAEAADASPDMSVLSGESKPSMPDVSALSGPTVMPKMASGRDYLDDPKVDAALNDLYHTAEPTFVKFGNANTMEHLIAVNKDGSYTEPSTSDPSQTRHMQTSIPKDAQMMIHTHPASAVSVPSPQDYQTATKTGKPNFVVSQGAIYVAMPGQDPNTSKHVKVADIDRKHGKLVYKWN